MRRLLSYYQQMAARTVSVESGGGGKPKGDDAMARMLLMLFLASVVGLVGVALWAPVVFPGGRTMGFEAWGAMLLGGTIAFIIALACLLAALRDVGKPYVAPMREPPAWFLPAGVIAILVGVLGFLGGVITTVAQGGMNVLAILVVTVTNPLCFLGLPLGFYWLGQYARRSYGPPQHMAPPNPNLRQCPDCWRSISIRAVTCPHCGRPANPVVS